MPRRSNYIQKLVYLLERHISGETDVQQSALLVDRIIGKKREVDIVIAGSLGPREVLIGVEVTASRADITWVEQMIGKHKHLPTDKLVLFAQGGFSKDAEEEAASEGVETVTLGVPEEADWPEIVGKLTKVYLARADLIPEKGTATLKASPGVEPEVGPDTVLFASNGARVCSFQELTDWFLSKANVLEQLYVREDREKLMSFRAEITLPQGLFMKDTEGNLHEVSALKLDGGCQYLGATADITSSRYRGSPVAYGKTTLGDQPLAFAVTEQENNPLKASIILFTSENDPGQVVDLTPREGKRMATGFQSSEPDEQ